MQIFRSRIAWAAYIIAAVLFFLYVLFPSDALKQYLTDYISQRNPNLTLKIDRLKLGFPPSLMLDKVNVYHSGWAIAALESLKISPDIISLFLTTTHLEFIGRIYGGTIEGDVDIIKKSKERQVVIDADLAGIQVSQLEALSALTTHKISGNLEGTLTFTAKAPHQELSGNLTLTDGQIELTPPVLAQNVLAFDSIDAEVVLRSDALIIESCEIEGNQLDGDVAGSIKFNSFSSRKILDLAGTVWPHETLLAQLGQHVPQLLDNSRLTAQGLPFKVKGPMDTPTYSFY